MISKFLSVCKPDCVKAGLVGEVIRRFEQRGLGLIYVKWAQLSGEQVDAMYRDRQDADYYDELKEFMLSGPVVVTVWEGEDASERGRQCIGAKIPVESAPGSIRGSLPALDNIQNLVHGSRSEEEALAEIAILASELGIGEPVPAANRPPDDAPYAPTELSAADTWEGEPVPAMIKAAWPYEEAGTW
jgi:nucleoside-diphosphate kinase